MSQITTHILDTARGCPAEGVSIVLFQKTNDAWHEIASGITNDDGRIAGLLDADRVLEAGEYRMFFQVEDYFKQQQLDAFYPYVDVVFRITGAGEHYHIPLLLSPFGYSTYRGS